MEAAECEAEEVEAGEEEEDKGFLLPALPCFFSSSSSDSASRAFCSDEDAAAAAAADDDDDDDDDEDEDEDEDVELRCGCGCCCWSCLRSLFCRRATPATSGNQSGWVSERRSEP